MSYEVIPLWWVGAQISLGSMWGSRIVRSNPDQYCQHSAETWRGISCRFPQISLCVSLSCELWLPRVPAVSSQLGETVGHFLDIPSLCHGLETVYRVGTRRTNLICSDPLRNPSSVASHPVSGNCCYIYFVWFGVVWSSRVSLDPAPLSLPKTEGPPVVSTHWRPHACIGLDLGACRQTWMRHMLGSWESPSLAGESCWFLHRHCCMVCWASLVAQ